MKIAVLGGWAPSLIAFRGPLIAAFAARGHEVVCAAADGEQAVTGELAAIGARYQELPLRRAGMNPVADTRTLAAVAGWLRRERPDLLLSYTIKPVIYGSLAARLVGVPRIFALVTGLGYSFLDRERPSRRALARLVRGMYRTALGGTSAVLFQNPDDEREFRSLGIVGGDQRTVVTNGSGVDLDHFAAAPPPESPRRFLFIGRLLREKGIMELVEAAREVKRRHPDVRVQVLGAVDPNPATLSQAEVDALHDEGTIEYLGETDDVRPFLRAAGALVLPSYREGTPRSVLEAMATARAVITTDVPGCRETVVHGDNGLLVPPRDPGALATAMERLLDAPEELARMGARSRALAEHKYDVHKVNATILDALELTP